MVGSSSTSTEVVPPPGTVTVSLDSVIEPVGSAEPSWLVSASASVTGVVPVLVYVSDVLVGWRSE